MIADRTPLTHTGPRRIARGWLLVLVFVGSAACTDTAAEGPSGADASSDVALDGAADTPTCPPGLAGCVDGDRVVCNEAGSAFEILPCEGGKLCSDGTCVACAVDADCDKGEVCTDNTCQTPPLVIATTALPIALVGQAYSHKLSATGGTKPYTWALDQGVLPAGILVGSDGEVKGVAKDKAVASVSIAVSDAKGVKVSRIFVLEVKAGGSLVISTSSPLKSATEGKPYSVQLQAKGGEKPHFWGLKSGKLPKGLGLGADGVLSGTPTEDGSFQFDIKVLDDGAPTLTATRTFELSVGLAPLEIIGKQQVNLFVTKVIVLPLIVVVKGVPVPYSTQLVAQGGKKPYTWAEQPLPGAVKSFIPNSGLPKGLTLGKDGTLSGSVTDPKLVVEVKIPLTQIALKGFFFAAKVTDSQNKAKSRTAMFIVPTAPIGP
ncbi:MAG: putative Ig domain-containing protein [Myxococcales bacterium]|nr:putative Ig domain-containing protein [Myxococcales bacterium]